MHDYIKIGVIDSGIDESLLQELHTRYMGGHGYTDCGDGLIRLNSIDDEHGHGTLCASLINKYVRNPHFYCIKIVDSKGKGNGRLLLQALKDLLDIDVKVINLSISAVNCIYSQEIEKVCMELFKQGKIIVCSQANNLNHTSFPAMLEYVIGVRGGTFKYYNEYWFNRKKTIQAVANATPQFYEVDNDIKCFKGNSKAAALLTTIIANKLVNNFNADYYELCNMLETDAQRKEWDDNLNVKDICPEEIDINKIDTSLYIKLKEILEDFLQLKNDETYILEHRMVGAGSLLNPDKCIDLIKIIKDRLNININYSDLTILDFYNIFYLCDAIENRWTLTK